MKKNTNHQDTSANSTLVSSGVGIKICGMKHPDNILEVAMLLPDYMGFIFWEKSARYFDGVIQELPKSIKKVGVFVNPELIDVLDAIDDYGLQVVQLHGDEGPEMCDDLSGEVEVIKAFRISGNEDIDKLVTPYDAVCDYYLFDTGGLQESLGGTGKQFDWNILKNAKIEKPFFLSGGISVSDAAKIKAFRHPDFFGVDINSRFETEPGVKDMSKVLQFKMALK